MSDADVTRSTLGAPAAPPPRPATVYVVEECACSTTHGYQLAAYLRRRLGPEVEVASLDRGHLSGVAPLPPAASNPIDLLQNARLPALVVDGRIRTEGVLPDFLDAVALIEGRPTSVDFEAAALRPAGQQRAPGSC